MKLYAWSIALAFVAGGFDPADAQVERPSRAPVSAPVDSSAALVLVLTESDYYPCEMMGEFETRTCGSLEHSPADSSMSVHVILHRRGGFPEGAGGIQFGFEYDGKVRVRFSPCTGGSMIPERGWPRSGTGNAVTWNLGCSGVEDELAYVGYFEIRRGDDGWGTFRLTGDPRLDGRAQWTDCRTSLFDICTDGLPVVDLADPGEVSCTIGCGPAWPKK